MQSTVKLPENANSLKEDVIKIVSEIVENKRIVLIENLFRIARRQTGADRIAIENVIDQLIKEKIIVPGSRITREIILRNITRQKIYFLIKKYPGINANTLKTELNLGINVIHWHLEILQKFGCIKEVIYKNSRLFGLPKLTNSEILFSFVLRKKLVNSIITALNHHTLSLPEIEKKTNEGKTTILYNIQNLLELNIIEKCESPTDVGILAYKISTKFASQCIGTKIM